MNVFILCTGRCGSVTFVEACQHISNFTSAHESRARLIGPRRMAYPDRHIEGDNRLSWMLGRLDQAYGDEAFYVHLQRDRIATARSLLNRYDSGIMRAYAAGILMRPRPQYSSFETCLDFCDTVNSNIETFLKHKPRAMNFALENAQEDFPRFWKLIGAEGNLDAALATWKTVHNASTSGSPIAIAKRTVLGVIRKLPTRARSA
jgi:hypothetical protein